MRRLTGGCHCGAIKYGFTVRGDGSIPVRVCGCTFCTGHAAAWTSDPDGTLEIDIADENQVNRYRFGTGSAEFCVCSRCGVVPVAVSCIDEQLYAVVNTNTLEAGAVLAAERMPSDFDGETVADRLDRRRRNWIADVRGINFDGEARYDRQS
jgi:hypothetical protein